VKIDFVRETSLLLFSLAMTAPPSSKSKLTKKDIFAWKAIFGLFSHNFPDSPFGQHMFLTSSQFAIKIDRNAINISN